MCRPPTATVPQVSSLSSGRSCSSRGGRSVWKGASVHTHTPEPLHHSLFFPAFRAPFVEGAGCLLESRTEMFLHLSSLQPCCSARIYWL